MKVLMLPSMRSFEGEESGIRRVCEAYHEFAPNYGIEFVDCAVEDESQYDLMAVHAGTTSRYPKHKPVCAILHGVYWTGDYESHWWELKTNSNVFESIRRATTITVPSKWVAETIARDVRVYPFIVPHGIKWQEWSHNYEPEGYALWNKNRNFDVCSPEPLRDLALKLPRVKIKSTFIPINAPQNIEEIGLKSHLEMKQLIQKASVYLSTTKETFGIGILEAMAAGVPVLGFAHGGNLEIVKHGVTGYLARRNDSDDLAAGLAYCLDNRKTLSENSIYCVKSWTWENSMAKLKQAFDTTLFIWNEGQRPLKISPDSYLKKTTEEKLELPT